MWTRLAAVLTVISFVGVCAAQQKPGADAKQIGGTWIWDAAHKQSDSKPEIILEQIEISGDKLTFHYRMGDQPWATVTKFKLDATATPKTIDFANVAGPNKGEMYRGLYEMEGDRLRICYRGPSSTRPKNFGDKALGNDGTVFIFLKPRPDNAIVQP